MRPINRDQIFLALQEIRRAGVSEKRANPATRLAISLLKAAKSFTTIRGRRAVQAIREAMAAVRSWVRRVLRERALRMARARKQKIVGILVSWGRSPSDAKLFVRDMTEALAWDVV